MAAMVTVLTELTRKGDNITYTEASHTLGAPRYVNVIRKFPDGNGVMADTTIQLAYGGYLDTAGEAVPQKIIAEVHLRTNVNIASLNTVLSGMLVTLADVALTDEGINTFLTQEPLL